MTDRLTITMAALAAFLVVLALLATQLGHAASTQRPARAVLLRRVYETKVIERVPATAKASPGASSATQSESSPGTPPASPVTRTS
jgi:Flp pilus assembly protein CpaB